MTEIRARAFKVGLDSASIETAPSMTRILVEGATRREDERNLRGGAPKKSVMTQTHVTVTKRLRTFPPNIFKGCTGSGACPWLKIARAERFRTEASLLISVGVSMSVQQGRVVNGLRRGEEKLPDGYIFHAQKSLLKLQ
ncbi:hypothetical protein ARMSODRAFT_980788 [Armillaria solidipes]|uniref:Uncharacterized protein n=1 Tax=Armillaria solidipes TaxID=1076256 RepID=A0A2H3B074_9AGAR|nr:hypothetical protein ARMSODRAFT_980788 [Armillaria solidipes]